MNFLKITLIFSLIFSSLSSLAQQCKFKIVNSKTNLSIGIGADNKLHTLGLNSQRQLGQSNEIGFDFRGDTRSNIPKF